MSINISVTGVLKMCESQRAGKAQELHNGFIAGSHKKVSLGGRYDILIRCQFHKDKVHQQMTDNSRIL